MMKNKKSAMRVFVSLLAGLGFMCFAAIFVKSSSAPGIVTTFYRMAIATGVLLIPFCLHRYSSKTKLVKRGIFFAILAGICFGLDMAFWSTGVVASNATLPTLTANLAPVWVGVGSILIFKERHKKGFWIGLVISFTGVFLLVGQDAFKSSSVLTGILFGLFAGIFYGAFYLISQAGRKLANTLSYLFISTLSSAILLFLLMLIMGYNFTGYNAHTWLMFLGISIGVQVCGWLLISYSQGHLPATIVAPTLLGQPVLTAILAAIFLGEALSGFQVMAGCMVIVGIYIVHFSMK